MSGIIGIDGDRIEHNDKAPKIKAIHPFSSQVLVEEIKTVDTIDTNIILDEDHKVDTAAQAYVIEIGPKVPEDSGLKKGVRIHWSGTGLPVDDPRARKGIIRALLEPHQIKAIIEEEDS